MGESAVLESTFTGLINMIMKNGLFYGGLLASIAGLQWMSGNKYEAKNRIIDIFVGYGITCSAYTAMAIMQKIGLSLGAK
jgi:succinate-acetate transporter protein